MGDTEPDENKVAVIEKELERWNARRHRKYIRFTLSVLSSIPWVGGFFSASASLWGESDQSRINELQRLWLQEHQKKLVNLGGDVEEIVHRFEELGAAASSLEMGQACNLQFIARKMTT